MNQHAKALLSRIQNQTSMKGGDYLASGQHRLALVTFVRRTSKKNPHSTEGRYQADFEVVSSNIYQPGQKCSVSFFVERSSFPEYEFDRAKQFIDACAACIGDTRGTADWGEDMLDPVKNAGRGIVIDVTVTPDMKDGVQKKSKTGKGYVTEAWTPIPQTPADVAAARAELDRTYPPEQLPVQQTAVQPPQQQWSQPQQPAQPQGAAWQQPAQPAQPQPGAPAPAGTSLLGRRGG